MDRRIASLAQAKLCRTRAEADPERRAYWMAEAVKWQQRADDQAEFGIPQRGPPAGADVKSLNRKRRI